MASGWHLMNDIVLKVLQLQHRHSGDTRMIDPFYRRRERIKAMNDGALCIGDEHTIVEHAYRLSGLLFIFMRTTTDPR